MRVFPKAIVLTTKSRFHVKRTYASIRGLVVRTITSGKTRISAIVLKLYFDNLVTNGRPARKFECEFIARYCTTRCQARFRSRLNMKLKTTISLFKLLSASSWLIFYSVQAYIKTESNDSTSELKCNL